MLMAARLERYVGRHVEIVYIDRRDRITQRTVVVLGIRGDAVRAYCTRKREHRLFKLDRILAVSLPGGRRTG
jgi:predicted DNA-binding transcriptional regulator YafY